MLSRRIQGLLLALAVVSGIWQITFPVDAATPQAPSWLWIGFLIGMPILLMALISLHLRWMAMAVVMYGTIGLALDIATLVQEMSRPKGGALMVGTGLLSGAINFLLIVCGGQGVLTGMSGEQLGVTHRPNPRSPFSS